jgi:Cu2+-exporting ATPase
MNQIQYTCPMHPEVRSVKMGLCPECGMSLVKTQNRPPDKHQGHSTEMFFQKFLACLLLTLPVVVSAVWPALLGAAFLPLIFGSIVFFYGGSVFLQGALREIYGRLPGMMTLIALAISAAYLWSIYAVLTGEEPLFWELTTLITIMLFGHWLEMKAVSSSQAALKELSKLLPDQAEVIDQGGASRIIPLSELRENDLVLVRPGAKVPADGQVFEGESDVNESWLTGESKPVFKSARSDLPAGRQVIAGTLNGDGALKVKAAKIGEETFLAGVKRLVAEAQASKSRLQILSDQAAFGLTIVAVIAGSFTLVAWIFSGAPINFAVARLVAVLVIACPHALGLAVPLVASISTTKAAQNGFLVKQRLALEAARSLDVVLFDKTGTLTKGEFGVKEIWSLNNYRREQVLELAASIDAFSEHPIARAVVIKARESGLTLKEPKNFVILKGRGAQAAIDNQNVLVGGPALLEELDLKIPNELISQVEFAENQGQTIIFVVVEREIIGALALVDVIREESRQAVKDLHQMGMRTAMITGDSQDVAQWVAQELGIDEFFSRVLPDQKSAKVKMLQERQLKVAMVGDGVNDAPALAQSDLGIAIGAGTNVAIESAGIILVRNDPRDIVKIIRLSRLTYAKMLQNLFWATGYNLFALPLAGGLLAFKGILLEPAVAAILMSASTVIVAVNALFLRRAKLTN